MQLGGDRHEHSVARILEGVGLIGLRFNLASDLAKQVELPMRQKEDRTSIE
jgi:hypothetical protein